MSRAAVRAHNLPSNVTLEGRERLVERVAHDLLTDGRQPNGILLHGPSGIGKSAIALAVGHRVLAARSLRPARRSRDVVWISSQREQLTRDGFLEAATLAGTLGDFVTAVKSCFLKMFGSDVRDSPDYSWIVNDRHCARVSGLLADAREKGATVVRCADYDVSRNGRQMPLHIVTDCTSEMRIMNEELFGPILPVVPYDSFEDVVRIVNAGDRPLAMYCFSHDAAERKSLLRRTHAGGVTVNDWGWHVVNHDAPFGGVGNSGMGTYHGVEGFRELSHAKTVFKRHRFFPIGLFYPPYGTLAQRLSLRMFLGTGDRSLK